MATDASRVEAYETRVATHAVGCGRVVRYVPELEDCVPGIRGTGRRGVGSVVARMALGAPGCHDGVDGNASDHRAVVAKVVAVCAGVVRFHRLIGQVHTGILRAEERRVGGVVALEDAIGCRIPGPGPAVRVVAAGAGQRNGGYAGIRVGVNASKAPDRVGTAADFMAGSDRKDLHRASGQVLGRVHGHVHETAASQGTIGIGIQTILHVRLCPGGCAAVAGEAEGGCIGNQQTVSPRGMRAMTFRASVRRRRIAAVRTVVSPDRRSARQQQDDRKRADCETQGSFHGCSSAVPGGMGARRPAPLWYNPIG